MTIENDPKVLTFIIQLATAETLRYYNALLVESTHQKVDLESRHVLQGSEHHIRKDKNIDT